MKKTKICKLPECTRPSRSRGMCIQDYRRLVRGDPELIAREPDFVLKICKVDGCERPISGRGYCDADLKRVVKYGSPDRKRAKRGEGEWKIIPQTGYVRANRPDHPNSAKNGTIHEHVFVMSEHLGRALRPGETVHHKNGIRSDNRIDNLELWISRHPAGQRVEDLIQFARDIIAEYGDQIYE